MNDTQRILNRVCRMASGETRGEVTRAVIGEAVSISALLGRLGGGDVQGEVDNLIRHGVLQKSGGTVSLTEAGWRAIMADRGILIR